MHKQPLVFDVDDENIIASSLATILRPQGGFEAKSFTLPLEALEAARLEAPDLLISDVGMPAMSGVELAILVRALCPDCKVLLFSGQASTADLLENARRNGYDFELLSKPVHPSELLTKIRSLTELTSSVGPAAELQVNRGRLA